MADWAALADQYADDVVAGHIVAGQWVVAACERHHEDRSAFAIPTTAYKWDPAAADRACAFIEQLPLSKAEWRNRNERFVLQPWQAFVVCSIFGWLERATGRRRFREAMLVLARKNGKSELAAAIALYMLLMDGENAPEVMVGASTEKQADYVFQPAKRMVEFTANLRQATGVQVHASALSVPRHNGTLQRLIGNPGDGGSPSCAIVDEYHEHPNSNLKETMARGMGARRNPLLLTITTAGEDVSSACFSDVLQGRSVVAGTLANHRLFYLEYSVDEGLDWTDPSCWPMANPNLDVSVFPEYLEDQLVKAKQNTRYQNGFKIKHLNQWVSAKHAYHNLYHWNQCYTPTVNMGALRGCKAYVGFDLASKSDIAAMVAVVEQDGGELAIVPHSYLPQTAVENSSNDAYKAWQTAGLITVTSGNATDYNQILTDFKLLTKVLDVREVVFDPHQAMMFMQQIAQLGVSTFEFSQWAANYTEPMRECCAMMEGIKLHHACAPDHPMTWMISNVVNKTNAKDQDFPNKLTPGNKIDGAVALYMAMARWMANRVQQGSVYETRGMLVLGSTPYSSLGKPQPTTRPLSW